MRRPEPVDPSTGAFERGDPSPTPDIVVSSHDATVRALATLPLDGALRARGETRFLFKAYLAKAIVTVAAFVLPWVAMASEISAIRSVTP